MGGVEVRTSSIEGLGLFAAQPFSSGQRIRRINVLREVTPASPLREELGERADHCDYPNGKIVLLGYPDRHVNHSCNPNAYVLYEGDCSFLVARRDIVAGEEITCDYNINITGGTAWPCHCGAARCRGTTVGDFFLLPLDTQRQYRPLLAEWFVRAHHDRLRALGLASHNALTIRPASAPDLDWCAELMVANDPWLTYKCSLQWSINVLRWPGSSLYVADADKPVGFILLHPKGFLGAPYIAAMLVAKEYRGGGIGSRMLAFAEQVFAGTRQVYLCVSSFNPRAIALYERHGYVKVGDLPDFIADGYSEFLLYKRLS